MGLVTTTRRYRFEAGHSLPSTGEGFHGHHFYVEITFRDLGVERVDQMFENIRPQVHGRDLGETVSPPTGEMLVQWLHKQLLLSTIGRHVVGVALQETPKNRFISSITGAAFV